MEAAVICRSAKEQIFSHGNMGKQARLLKDLAQRLLVGGNERAAAILPGAQIARQSTCSGAASR